MTPLRRPNWPNAVPRQAPERNVGVAYDTDWSRRYPVRLARALVLDGMTRPAVRAVASPSVVGAERLQDLDAPAIFAANHASHLDTAILLVSLPTRFRHKTVVGAGADYFFDRTWKAATWAFAAALIPIERTKVDRQSIALASELLSEGWNLVIFPEGGRTHDGWGQPFTGGAAYLGKKTARPVVPVHLEGTRRVLGKDGRRLRPGPTTVSFGAPLWPRDDEDARTLSARIEGAVAALADEAGSDWWQARQRAARGQTPSLLGPQVNAWRRAWLLEDQERPDRAPRWPLGRTGSS